MIKGIMNGLLGEVYSYAYDQIGYKRSKKQRKLLNFTIFSIGL